MIYARGMAGRMRECKAVQMREARQANPRGNPEQMREARTGVCARQGRAYMRGKAGHCARQGSEDRRGITGLMRGARQG
jgi:hypothetical protein